MKMQQAKNRQSRRRPYGSKYSLDAADFDEWKKKQFTVKVGICTKVNRRPKIMITVWNQRTSSIFKLNLVWRRGKDRRCAWPIRELSQTDLMKFWPKKQFKRGTNFKIKQTKISFTGSWIKNRNVHTNGAVGKIDAHFRPIWANSRDMTKIYSVTKKSCYIPI